MIKDVFHPHFQTFSNLFKVSNGVRQGAVSSAILFAVYIDGLLELLKKSQLGCHIDSVFVGAFIFADDILLLSASRAGLQSLVDICNDFASSCNLKFGTNVDASKSKTKCIVFSKRAKDSLNLAPILLDGQKLPWVKKVTHLGCILDSDNSMKSDIANKRGKFIGKINSILQEFHYASPEILFKVISVYATSFYGSSVWDLQSKNAEKLYTSWNIMIRNVFKLDRLTHRSLIEPLSGSCHLKTMLLSRYAKFYKELISSPKFTIRFLARLCERDMRTVMGRTLGYIMEQCNIKQSDLDSISPRMVKSTLTYVRKTEEDKWITDLAVELMKARNGKVEILGISREEIDELFNFICTN